MNEHIDNLFQLLCSPAIASQLLGVQLAHSQLNIEERIELSRRWLKFFSGQELSTNFVFPLYENGQETSKGETYIYAAGILSDTVETLLLRHWKESDLPSSF